MTGMTGVFPPRMPRPKRLLMTALLLDAQVQAVEAQRRLETMFDELGDDQFKSAARAIEGLDEQVHYVVVTMRRVAQLDEETRSE